MEPDRIGRRVIISLASAIVGWSIGFVGFLIFFIGGLFVGHSTPMLLSSAIFLVVLFAGSITATVQGYVGQALIGEEPSERSDMSRLRIAGFLGGAGLLIGMAMLYLLRVALFISLYAD